MSLERVPQNPQQRVAAQNLHDMGPANMAVQQSLQEIFDEFSVFISNRLRSQHPEDFD